MKAKAKEATKLEIENNNLEDEITKLKEELVAKDDEVRKNIDEKAGLQEKMESLLDLLYGCKARLKKISFYRAHDLRSSGGGRGKK